MTGRVVSKAALIPWLRIEERDTYFLFVGDFEVSRHGLLSVAKLRAGILAEELAKKIPVKELRRLYRPKEKRERIIVWRLKDG